MVLRYIYEAFYMPYGVGTLALSLYENESKMGLIWNLKTVLMQL